MNFDDKEVMTDQEITSFVDSFYYQSKISDYVSPDRDHWTHSDIDTFNRSYYGKFCRTIVETKNWPVFAGFMRQAIACWLEQNSLRDRIVELVKQRDDSKQNCVYRDFAAVAWEKQRYGSFPNQNFKHEKIVAPNTTVGNSVRIDTYELMPWSLASAVDAIAVAIQREYDRVVIRSITDAANADHCIASTQSGGSAKEVLYAVGRIAQHGLVPALAVMNTTQYISLVNEQSPLFKNVYSLRDALALRRYGSLAGIPIEVSTMADKDKIIVLAAPDKVGVEFDVRPIEVTYEYDTQNLVHVFTSSLDYAMLIVADYSFSIIKYKTSYSDAA